MLGLFFWELRGSLQKRRVRHMPALQLAGIRQFIEVYFTFPFHVQKEVGLRKTMENNHFKYS
jgi:hypothetical protein